MGSFDIYRFSGDILYDKEHIIKNDKDGLRKRAELLSSSLKIAKDITPLLYKLTEEIRTVLNLDDVNMEFYVYPNQEINAYCFLSDNDDDLIVVLYSGLVNLLSKDELLFVMGHEVGHYIFGHLEYESAQKDDLNTLKYSQAKEISADRIGLMCSKNISSSLRAIIKTASGLDDRHVSNSLHTFLHQHDEIDGENLFLSTHPTLPTRAKALTLFSMSEPYYKFTSENKTAPINASSLDKLIMQYLNKTSLKNIYDMENELIAKFNMWLVAKIYVLNSDISQKTFTNIAKECNLDKINSLIEYIKTNGKEAVDRKYLEAKNNMDMVSLESKKENLKKIKEVLSKYNLSNRFHI
jgi:predicted Zn-dependent protease